MGRLLDTVLPHETHSAKETRRLGARVAPLLPPGTVLALVGDLGAGKTQFVKGLVDGLGGEGDNVSSPTFTIAQEYAAGDSYVLHIDAYRVEDPREFVEMGMTDSMDLAQLVAVEWPSRMGPVLPHDAVRLEISHAGGDARRIRCVP